MGAGGPHPAEMWCFFLFLFSPIRWSGDATFLAKRKWPKIGQRGFPFGNPFDGKGLCGPYPQSRQAAVTVHPTSHVPPANAAKQVGRKYVWRHLPLRGTRGQHFTVFQYQPPGRQPFGLKVKSPRAFGPAPLPEGGPSSYPGGSGSPDSAANSGRAGAGWPPLARNFLRPPGCVN